MNIRDVTCAQTKLATAVATIGGLRLRAGQVLLSAAPQHTRAQSTQSTNTRITHAAHTSHMQHTHTCTRTEHTQRMQRTKCTHHTQHTRARTPAKGKSR